MDYNILGKTGMNISRLGIGLAEIGIEGTTQKNVTELLNTAIDLGINFFDTAACYNNSEDLVGNAINSRRDEFFLATKCGHPTNRINGTEWTKDIISKTIDDSLKRLKTDYLDLIQLHSCEKEILEKGDVITALTDAKKQGKTRFIGYSGDNDNAIWAVEHNTLFDTLQTSFNLVDQKARRTLFKQANQAGLGIIIKRPIANGAWNKAKLNDPNSGPSTEYGREYFERAKIMVREGNFEKESINPIKTSISFTLSYKEINTAIIGTRNINHLKNNINMLNEGYKIDSNIKEKIEKQFDICNQNWEQLN